MSGGLIAAAVIGIGGAAMAAETQRKAGSRAAGAQINANNLAIDEQQRQYDQTREDMAPFRQIGYDAAERLRARRTPTAGTDYMNQLHNPGMMGLGKVASPTRDVSGVTHNNGVSAPKHTEDSRSFLKKFGIEV